jgi:outer membrane cobalamin receptor
MAAPAIAQDMPATAAAPDLDQKGEGVGDIVATATKRETSLQKTLIATSVVSDAMM